MDGATTPGVRVAARDGGELSVSPDGVRIGARHFPLERIQDARQVSPDPETIALRVAGFPLVEFRPARQGDGRLALEAIYRLRPDLRPVGFEGPETLPAGFPPLPTRPAQPLPFAQQYPGYAPMPPVGAGYPPPSYPSSGYPVEPPPGYPGMARPGFPPPQGRYMPYPVAPSPNRLTGEVTPYPREPQRGIQRRFPALRQIRYHLAGAWPDRRGDPRRARWGHVSRRRRHVERVGQ